MEKQSLNGFIQRYSLSGNIESVKWISGEGSISTNFISDDKNLIGSVTLKQSEIEPAEIAIYDTTKLKNMLSVLNDDLTISLKSEGDRYSSIKLNDGRVSVNYMLAQMSVIPAAPVLKSIPNFDINVKIDASFITRFIKTKTALSNEDKFTIHLNDGQPMITLGYSDQNTNRISIDIELEDEVDSIKPISFSAKYLKEILLANRDAENAFLKISSQGLLHIGFTTNEYDSNYYLIKIEDN